MKELHPALLVVQGLAIVVAAVLVESDRPLRKLKVKDALALLDGVGHEVVVDGQPPAGNPPIGWARDVVAFLKEALTNARRHGKPERVTVRIGWGEMLDLTVEDDGVGFDPDEGRGFGLGNLEKRAGDLGGVCEIASSPGGGTRVRMRVPVR